MGSVILRCPQQAAVFLLHIGKGFQDIPGLTASAEAASAQDRNASQRSFSSSLTRPSCAAALVSCRGVDAGLRTPSCFLSRQCCGFHYNNMFTVLCFPKILLCKFLFLYFLHVNIKFTWTLRTAESHSSRPDPAFHVLVMLASQDGK